MAFQTPWLSPPSPLPLSTSLSAHGSLNLVQKWPCNLYKICLSTRTLASAPRVGKHFNFRMELRNRTTNNEPHRPVRPYAQPYLLLLDLLLFLCVCGFFSFSRVCLPEACGEGHGFPFGSLNIVLPAVNSCKNNLINGYKSQLPRMPAHRMC